MLVIRRCSFKSEEETCNEEREAINGDESESTNEDEVESEEETWDQEWELADGDEFCSLQFLNLEYSNLVRWRADETNFPRLRHLRLRDCWDLEEIPSFIGEIPTLQLIELISCTKSAVASAERIVEEQSEYGNDDLKLRISKTLG